MDDRDDLFILGDGPGAGRTARSAAERGLRVRWALPAYGAGDSASSPGWPWPLHGGDDIATPVEGERAFLSGGGGVCLVAEDEARSIRPGLLVVAPRPRPARPSWWSTPLVPPRPPATAGEPDRLVVLGGGATGVQTAGAWADGRRRVTLVEVAPRLLPDWDAALAAPAVAALAAAGVEILTGWRAVHVGVTPAGVRVALRARSAGGQRELDADLVFPALGWRPDFAGYGLERTRALLDRDGFVQTDGRLATAERGLHALGAALAVPLSTAGVSGQAELVVALAVGGRPSPVRHGVVPRVIAGPVPLLTAGLTAAGATARGYRVVTGRAGDAAAWVRCVRDAESGTVLGVQAAGAAVAGLSGPVGGLLLAGPATPPLPLPPLLAAARAEAACGGDRD